jgi:Carboxypeptidase regulatory-like domain
MPRKTSLWLGFLLFFLTAPGRAPVQTAAQSNPSASAKAEVDPKDECKISGLVVKLAGSEPIRGATAQLQSADDRSQSVTILTDADGRFSLKGIEPGRYHLRVSRNGFVLQEYGQRSVDDPGSVLSLRAGQDLTDVVFRLIPSAVISGRVLNEDGEPQPWVNVSAMRQAYEEGKKQLVVEANFQTNDLGEYRLFGLRPGRYFISAMAQQWERLRGERQSSGSDTGQQGYAKTFYPGVIEASKATAFTVKAGEEIPSVDILLRPVRVFQVHGKLFNDITHRPGTNAGVALRPRGRRFEWDERVKFAQVIKPDGTFDVDGVLPGSYYLIGHWFDGGKLYTARTAVDVTTSDVDASLLSITAGVSINGRVFWDGPPSLKDPELYVNLRATDVELFSAASERVGQDNLFTLKNVGEGAYELEVMGESQDCFLKGVRYGEDDALETGFTITRGSPASLEVTISSRGGRVKGSVANADHLPAAGVWVVLVPDPPRRGQERLYKTQTTDQFGHFDIHGIAPGDYKLFSWDEVEEGAWQDPEFLKPFEEKGERVSVKELDQKTVNLTTIAAPASEENVKP